MSGKILIADSVATNRILLKVRLASAHYEVIQATTGAEALHLAGAGGPDLVLADMNLADMPATELCRRLGADPATAPLPVVVLTAGNDPDERVAVLCAGAEDVICRPVEDVALLARIRSLLRATADSAALPFALHGAPCAGPGLAEPGRAFVRRGVVGLVAGRIETALGWKGALMPLMRERLQVLDRDSALSDFTAGEVPDLFLVAAALDEADDGLRLMSELRSRPATRHTAVCLMVDPAASGLRATALDLGASDVIETGAPPAETAMRLHVQVERKRAIDGRRHSLADRLRLAVIDPLTGLHNRRHALPYVARLAAGEGGGQAFALLVIDIDRFKSVNDDHGHAAGDAVLAEIARRLKDEVRTADMVARIGGEEFLVALPDTGFSEARHIAERLRRAVSERPVCLPGGQALRITMSIGLAMGDRERAGEDADALLARADRALLTAKTVGRNQVIVGRSAA